ncbi:MAG: sugar kinase [Dehalococcoidia bacterium]|nr:MAG: sugar kinase [Dehalococcoidia bacterium]
MLIAGTIPNKDIPLILGQVRRDGDSLFVDGKYFSCIQGTGAMISAALAVTTYLKLEPPKVLVVGDIGDGKGSRELYSYLIDNITSLSPDVFVMHYCLPIMALMRQLCKAIENCNKKPFMVADAGAMYAAKAASLASEFDILTPDPSEIAFLADAKATHPAYIAEHLFRCTPKKIPEQIKAAFDNGSAADLLLVKGETDYVANESGILAEIDQPDVPKLEAIGGTGDTITGLVSALVYADLKPHIAAIIAARANRMAGKFAEPTPATKVRQIIDQFPMVFKEYLCEWSENCSI